MTDIVERLRCPGGMEEGESISSVVNRLRSLLMEAAAEIERLQAETVLIRQLAGCIDVPIKTFSDIKKEIKHG